MDGPRLHTPHDGPATDIHGVETSLASRLVERADVGPASNHLG